jgi:hypothetical protein
MRLLIATLVLLGSFNVVAQEEMDEAPVEESDELPLEESDDVPADEPAPAEDPLPEDAPPPSEEGIEEPLPGDESTEESSMDGIFKDFRFGPTLALGIPHPLNLSFEVMYKDFISGGFSTGRLSLEIEDATIQIANWDVRLRYHPFAGSFFVGAAYGKQELVGKMSKDMKTKYQGLDLKVPTTLRLGIDSTYLTPHFGWFSVWESGFTMGFELGYQMSLDSSSELQTAFKSVSSQSEDDLKNSDEYKKNKKDIEDTGKTIGEQGIFYVTLIRMGWLF